MAPGGRVHVSVEVTNTGEAIADEVVQLYLSHPGVELAAMRELKGFRRIRLNARETERIEFELNSRDVSIVDAAGTRRLQPGDVGVWIGGGQPHARGGLRELPGVGTSFHLDDAEYLPE